MRMAGRPLICWVGWHDVEPRVERRGCFRFNVAICRLCGRRRSVFFSRRLSIVSSRTDDHAWGAWSPAPDRGICALRRTCGACLAVGYGDRHEMRSRPLADLQEPLRSQALAKAAYSVTGWSNRHVSVPCTSANVCEVCGYISETVVQHRLKSRRNRMDDARCLTPGCGYVSWGDEGDAT